jgi:hypothetical protein
MQSLGAFEELQLERVGQLALLVEIGEERIDRTHMDVAARGAHASFPHSDDPRFEGGLGRHACLRPERAPQPAEALAVGAGGGGDQFLMYDPGFRNAAARVSNLLLKSASLSIAPPRKSLTVNHFDRPA